MVCEGAYENYTGDKACAYNMARAFLETKSFLNKNLGWSSDNWMWRNVHSNEYPNTPWSKTPLRPLFHREIPTPGNTNTPNVAKISTKKAADANRFVSTHAANLKFAIQMHEDPKQEINLFSIDTGNGQNIFQANYFDMNRAHLDGNLHTMYLGADIQDIKTETLIIRPK
jgi:acyl-homoserine lactone acylase PvdQ